MQDSEGIATLAGSVGGRPFGQAVSCFVAFYSNVRSDVGDSNPVATACGAEPSKVALQPAGEFPVPAAGDPFTYRHGYGVGTVYAELNRGVVPTRRLMADGAE